MCGYNLVKLFHDVKDTTGFFNSFSLSEIDAFSSFLHLLIPRLKNFQKVLSTKDLFCQSARFTAQLKIINEKSYATPQIINC